MNFFDYIEIPFEKAKKEMKKYHLEKESTALILRKLTLLQGTLRTHSEDEDVTYDRLRMELPFAAGINGS